jgi:4-amino-4-deoxy-L-arabinose transferase-like glycosyltransferase
MTKRSYLAAATLILLLAAGLRIYGLAHGGPPGLHYDEAADMLLGRDIAFYGYAPFPVVMAYSGREALFYYLSVPLLHILGGTVFATRLTSAFLGILTVAVTLALGKALFGKNRQWPSVALMAAALLAVNGAQVWLTRQGFRTSPQPLLEALALWLLVVAMLRPKRWLLPAVLGGFFAGLSLYVYMAARIFPLWLGLLCGLMILLGGQGRRRRLALSLVFGAAMTISGLPILLFYAQNPAILLDRLAQLAPTGQTVTLAESFTLHLQMFFLQGDPLLRYNLWPGRPFFDPVSGLLMLSGLAGSGWLLWRGRGLRAKLIGACLLLSPLLILPSVAAVNGLPPSHMRSVAMVPLIFFLPAAAWVVLAGKLPARLSMGISLLFVGGLALHTAIDYAAWAGRTDLFYDSHGDYALAGQWLETEMEADGLAYITSEYYEHPTILAHKVDSGRVRWQMADHLLLPPTGQSALYILPRGTGPNTALAAHVADNNIAPLAGLPTGPDSAPAFSAYRINGVAATPSGPIFAAANGGPLLQLNGTTNLAGQAGQEITLSSTWVVLATPASEIAPVVRLYDEAGNLVAEAYPYFEQTTRWRAGEQVLLKARLSVPPGNPPGSYQAQVGWFMRDSLQPMPVVAADGSFLGLAATIAQVDLLAGGGQVQPSESAIRVNDDLLLLAAPALPEQLAQGENLRLQLAWYLKAAPYAGKGDIEIALGQAGAEPIILWRGGPVRGQYPMAQWQQGEYVLDRYNLRLDNAAPAGLYTLNFALDGRVFLSHSLNVLAVARNFDLPANMLLPAGGPAQFADGLQLAGYNADLANGQLNLQLAWQASSTPSQDYTVFVHVVGADGVNFSQADLQPARPSSRLLAGEVLIEAYQLALPNGPYTVRVGLYLQATGTRLGVAGGDYVVLPIEMGR